MNFTKLHNKGKQICNPTLIPDIKWEERYGQTSVANGLCVFPDNYYCYVNTFLCLCYLNRRSNTTLISLVHRWAEVTGDDANELRKWMEYRTSLDSKDKVLISDKPIAVTFVFMLVRHFSNIVPDMDELQEAYEEARYIIDSNRLSVSLFAL